MHFYSYIFVFAFLPVTLIGYFAFQKWNRKFASAFLIGMSLFFYGFHSLSYMAYFVACILGNYLLISQILKGRHKKALLAVGLGYNIGALLVLKYCNFFIDSLNRMLHQDFHLIHLFLPLGISFYTFQFIALLIDSYHERIENFSLETYLAFTTFFPKIIQGPIMLYQDFAQQYQDEKNYRFQIENLSKGLYAFTLGLGKKILIAELLGKFVNYGFDGAYKSFDSFTSIMLILAYTLQIYFDFSGYTDMARGIGYMFNIELPINFNSPYKALSVNDFWKRWHISLTSFFTKYVYIPLGGNRKGEVRTLINVFLVFLISGLWHGANYTFLIWGILHGLASIIERKFIKLEKINTVLRWIFTFGFVNAAWVFFRADSVGQALYILRAVVRCDFRGVDAAAVSQLSWTPMADLMQIMGMKPFAHFPYLFLILLLVCVLQCKNTDQKITDFSPKPATSVFTAVILAGSILSFGGTVSFIYERF